jgi:para-nitrobenzyl esterase
MSSDTTSVLTPTGTITGQLLPSAAAEFRGIRYATTQRFQSPVDVVENGSVDALSYQPICPQLPGALEAMVSVVEPMSEDCTFLNVYVPAGVTNQSKLPVLFWIHGGAYTNGSGSLSWYNGSSLATRDCVVVTINYRLGVFGFLGQSNLGIQDMVSALRWVQRNIASFGGDTNNVTIFGESAGGSALVALMACDSAAGLFHKVWAMSPSIGQLRDQNSADNWKTQFLDIVKAKSIDELAILTTDQLLAAQAELLTRPSTNFDMFTPTAAGELLSHDILESAANNPVPFVVGTNRDENKLWTAFDATLNDAGQEHWTQVLEKQFGAKSSDAKKAYEALRAGDSVKDLCSALQTDVSFRSRAISLAERRADAETATWMYWFTWQSPAFGGILGCCHALDIPFAFDNLNQDGANMFTGDGPERAHVAATFADNIAGFAKTSQAAWPAYDRQDRSTLEINESTEVLSDPESEIRILFSK